MIKGISGCQTHHMGIDRDDVLVSQIGSHSSSALPVKASLSIAETEHNPVLFCSRVGKSDVSTIYQAMQNVEVVCTRSSVSLFAW